MNIAINNLPCINFSGSGWMFALGAISMLIIIIVLWFTFVIIPQSRI